VKITNHQLLLDFIMYRTALSRILVVAVPRHALAARAFFVEGGGQATQDKLRAIMEEYRQAK
jgi:hypothetical protein